MIGYDIAGMPRPVGSTFKQRELWAGHHVHARDGHVVPWVVSVVETVGGTALEARFHLDHALIVATELESHTMCLQDVVARAKRSLAGDDTDDRMPRPWVDVTVRPCTVSGCDNPMPLWAHDPANRRTGIRRNETGECVPCRVRTVLACVECGMPDRGQWMGNIRGTVLAKELCHRCLIWTDRLAEGVEIITGDGMMYSVGRAGVTPASCRGFGGDRFRVSFLDGRTVETDNLWCGGQVPAWFRDRFVSNAVVERI